MFANFLYFIIALLILTLYVPTETPPYSLLQALSMFIGLSVLFGVFIRAQFRRLARLAPDADNVYLDSRFTLLMTRHSVLALAVFALDIWGLHLPSYLLSLGRVVRVPTLNAAIFLVLFIGYLTLIWFMAYDAQRAIYKSDLSRKTYVSSNIAFSVPILIPWLLLSGITDLLQALPFEWPKLILENTFGQIGFFLVFLVIASIFAPVLIQRFWRCRPMEPGFHRGRIEQLCHQAGVRYADILYWPIFGGRMITAGVMGLVSRFRYILVTETLLRVLKPDEVDQVIAHEIGHVRRKHLLLYLLFFVGFMLVWYAALILSYYTIDYIYPFIMHLSVSALVAHNIILAVLLIVSAIFYFRYIFGYFMRNFERQADLFVFELFPSAQPLIDTFDKIVLTSGQPADKPNWHHFSIQQRVDYLRRCEKSSFWIKRQDSKVRKSIALYLVAIVLLGVGLFEQSPSFFSTEIRNIDLRLRELYLSQKKELGPRDAPDFWALGNSYAVSGQYAKAAAAYEKGLKLNSDTPLKLLILYNAGMAFYQAKDDANAARTLEEALRIRPADTEILNNLAWVLATTEDKTVYNPVRSLALAQKALDLEKAPHILDTYAQALFVNGRIEEAVRFQEQALASASEDRDSYQRQLDKFKKALKTQVD